ncbi:MAG: YadA-like family protein [Phascolarctobacterium sp.]|nr:YadA-like family protein [Phascolarctobacterium sp.]MDO4920456.1 YadA-like family protein [Phascolarctobacterium sp.]
MTAESKGNWSLALGQGSKSIGNHSVAMGNFSEARGASSLAFGANSKAHNMLAVALGEGTKVTANYGLALGAGTSVTASSSVAIGFRSEATESDTVSFGNNNTKRRLVNVAAGTSDTDAVNVGQLNTAVANEKTERIAAINAEATARETADARLEQRVDDMERGIDGRFDKLDSKIDKVGAGAAALAALHPLDYDPDDKLNFAVGLGNYRGEQAAALGAFYRPDETIMLSVGGTMGNNDNMVNLGVSFALDGRRAKAKESRAKLEAKLENMSGELAEVKAQLALLMQQQEAKQ